MCSASDASHANAPAPPPRALISRNPLEWLRVFGPGAVIASLTIGVGELIFSVRGGVIFGYAILFPFLLICLLKWTLAYSAARHMVLSGAHPFQRWMDLPFGPRGWLTVLFLMLAVAFIPVWVSFHCSVIGDFLADLTGTKHYLAGATIYLWGAGLLVTVLALAVAGGYAALEKIQLVIVVGMLAAVIATLMLFGPDWFDLLRGFVVPQRLDYPAWFTDDLRANIQQIAERPVWVELSLYVGVIGGASYDYLAYTSYLRDKSWGNAAQSTRDPCFERENTAPLDELTLRQWMRAPLIDCTLSFVVVLLFAAVFVASGKLVLGPARQIPGDDAFLEHQAQFVTHIHPWLYPLYVVAVFLTLFGTLYGTLEVAPTVLREAVLAFRKDRVTEGGARRIRMLAILWCSAVAMTILAVSFVYQLQMGGEKPPRPTAILIPVNLFTGVFGCGLVCLLNAWMDRHLPTQHRMPLALVALNVIGGVIFILVALRGYWDYAGWWAMGILLAILTLGGVIAWLVNLSLDRG
ncbi:MAG: Nramp family divalent metal transporter [Planctomycetes bacterium]|nr:Nramp family divalent metal transporter [Planctomycetota bacterium]